MTNRLQSKRCLITGAGSGMARAGAIAFAREGGAIAVLDINLDAADAVAKDIVAAGGQATAHLADVTKPESIEAAVTAAVGELGGLDVCWANAGAGGEGSVVSTSFERWNEVIALNLSGSFLTAKFAVPHLIEAGKGSLMFTSSTGALAGTPNVASNMAAKAGLLGLTRQMSMDYLKDRIRVNAICPGPIRNPALVDNLAERDRQMGQPEGTTFDHFLSIHPLGRIGEPEDIANVALFLASDEATWVNNQFINVSGTGL